MSLNGAGRELGSTPPTESDCRLHPIAEALKEVRRPPTNCIGVIACAQCLGVFDVRSNPGEDLEIDNPGHISCLLGYSNNPEAHIEETNI